MAAGGRLAMASGTLEAMARGGIYDQLAGGFARYSVDAAWMVPHFEKMLYDNALLAGVYAHWWRRTGSDLARRVTIETCEWLLARSHPRGRHSAVPLDADSDGAKAPSTCGRRPGSPEVLGTEDGAYARVTSSA